ncbi:MAG TPA: sigma-70 family RNA polymerase sigma factor [Marmoricola sp.]|nr:sigma-70 family RNA polymerase sigma factor [Marmoricola sp.]
MDQTCSVAELVRAARNGDQRSWNDLVDRFLPLVTRLTARFRLYGADAEDVNQTVWLRLVEHLDAIREPNAVPGWIATTTRHECLAVIRRRGKATPVDPLGDSSIDRLLEEEDPCEELLRDERHRALRAGLAELPEDRRALLLVLLEDPPPSYAEISRRLGMPVGSIGPTRARALDHLRSTEALNALLAAPAGAAEQRR